MSEATKLTLKQEIVSLSSTTAPPKARNASSTYQLHNDTNSHISVFRLASDTPQTAFVLAPGATSDSHPTGEVIYILYAESGSSTQLTWTGWDAIYVNYHSKGCTNSDGVNNVSSF
jgi:hypothetical protein